MSGWWLLLPGVPTLAAGVLWWLWRRERKAKAQADTDRDTALGQLDDRDRLISRRDEVIRVLRSDLDDAHRAVADIARAHPELAREFVRDVMRRAAAGGDGARAGVPGPTAPAVSRGGPAGDG